MSKRARIEPRNGLEGRAGAPRPLGLSEIDLSSSDVAASFEGSTSPENRYIMGRLGDIRGKRVLNLVCGAGESPVRGHDRGRPKLAALHGVEAEFRVMDAMEPDVPDASFDIIRPTSSTTWSLSECLR